MLQQIQDRREYTILTSRKRPFTLRSGRQATQTQMEVSGGALKHYPFRSFVFLGKSEGNLLPHDRKKRTCSQNLFPTYCSSNYDTWYTVGNIRVADLQGRAQFVSKT